MSPWGWSKMGAGRGCTEGPSALLGCCRQAAPHPPNPHLASEEDNTGILIIEGQERGRGHVKAKDRQGSLRQSLCPVQEDPSLAAAAGR